MKSFQSPQQPLPIAVTVMIAWCTTVFVGLNSIGGAEWNQVAKFGYLPESRLYEGAWYGLISSAFVHIDLIHFVFNMYWLWILGGALERAIGPVKMVMFCVGAAFVSSGWELALGDSGIGFSGVGYAIAGFGCIAREHIPELKQSFTDYVLKLFIGWGALCIVFTYLKIWNVGNLAHASGLVFGVLFAMAVYRTRLLTVLGVSAVTCLAIVPLFYNPFSQAWLHQRASNAYDRQQWREADTYYRRLLQQGGDPASTWANIAQTNGMMGRQAEYQEAMEHLKVYDRKMADEVGRHFDTPE